MSYWNEIEKTPGSYDFTELDEQIRRIAKAGGTVSLCLGARQPRWPENHWPDWAWSLPKEQRSAALLKFLEVVIQHCKNNPCIVSYQLENEALLKEFGERSEVDRARLRAEFALVKRLDPERPVAMTTSTSWGIPLRKPIPDAVGFSFYQILYNKGVYSKSFHSPKFDRLRAALVKLLWRKSCFIHELQLEPWGPQNIWEMTTSEQNVSMSPEQIKTNLKLAQATKLHPVDIWGGEWWYWRCVVQKDKALLTTVKEALTKI